VQSDADLDPAWFRGVARVGLTAGTSTLTATIDEVHRALVEIGKAELAIQAGDVKLAIRDPSRPAV
jgi:4-hydroxy-3-methylbut-2-enyl diphosphate reductase IspH